MCRLNFQESFISLLALVIRLIIDVFTFHPYYRDLNDPARVYCEIKSFTQMLDFTVCMRNLRI